MTSRHNWPLPAAQPSASGGGGGREVEGKNNHDRVGAYDGDGDGIKK